MDQILEDQLTSASSSRLDRKPVHRQFTTANREAKLFRSATAPSSALAKNTAPVSLAAARIVAQKIRHLDVLLVDPWVIKVGPENDIPLSSPMDINVANPLCYMVQKFLIKDDRPAAKKAQDILYVYDTIELFGALVNELHEHWVARVQQKLGKARSKIVRERARETFLQVNDLTRAAAQIPVDRSLSAERIKATCQHAFSIILGGQ